MMPWRVLQRRLCPSSKAVRDRGAALRASVVVTLPGLQWQQSVTYAMHSLILTTRGLLSAYASASV
jgi:protein-arginine kinase